MTAVLAHALRIDTSTSTSTSTTAASTLFKKRVLPLQQLLDLVNDKMLAHRAVGWVEKGVRGQFINRVSYPGSGAVATVRAATRWLDLFYAFLPRSTDGAPVLHTRLNCEAFQGWRERAVLWSSA